MPYSLIELATSKDVATYENYEIGKIFVRSAWDLITDVKIFEKIAVSGEL
jgi:carbamoyl-phosphate synthase large subunit